MRLLDTMLAAYGDDRYILQLKARFLLNIHAAIITAILIVLGYSTYFHMNNPFVGNAVDPGIFGVTAGALLLVLACAVLLIRGHFTQSAHITVVGLFIAVWAGMILDDTETLTRLDTAVLAIAAISCSPLLVTRRSRVILFYSIINLAAFYAYMFYYRAELNLSATAFYSHLADNTVAFFIIGISSYNVFTITARAMEKLEENSEKLARTCMELQAATEDLEAANEEFEAQNEELVRSEEELLQSHATLESFVNALPEPAFLIDGERRLLAVNTAFLSRSGMTRQEVLGRNVIALTGAGNAEHFDACFREGKSAVFESNTGERHFVNYVYPVLNQKGRTSRAAVFSIDITQRKNTEARLIREKMFTSTMLDTLPGIFFMLDRDGNFIRWKGLGKTETTFGYRTDELLTMNALDIVDEKERVALAEKMEEVFMHGHASAEIAISARDGGITHYHLSGSRMVLGSDMYLIGIGTDITDRKRAEEERERTRMQLVQAQKMEAVGTLAGGIAHDFNNMLGGIMGSINMMEILLGKENHPHRETILSYVETAKEASRRAADMIRQLLTLSRRSELRLAPVDITTSMKHVQKLCAGSLPKSVEIDFRAGGEPLRINADPVQMEQVILNLCVNASHAMTIMRPDGERQGGALIVQVEEVQCDGSTCPAHPDVEPGAYVRIRVSDNGVGMDEETRRHIFDPFYTTKQQGVGTGLGLAITYSIVKQHGGFIDVTSEPGRGSTFTVCLPALRDTSRVTRDTDTGARVVRGRGTVLVIDDEATMRHVASGMLEYCGYRVITAGSRDEAESVFRKEVDAVDAVLLDLSMPGTSGLEVFERLREIKSGVHVLLCSGLIEGVDLGNARERGIRGFIRKPYTVEEISAKISEIL